MGDEMTREGQISGEGAMSKTESPTTPTTPATPESPVTPESPATPESPKRAQPAHMTTARAVLIAVVGVVAFACAFIGLVLGLDALAHVEGETETADGAALSDDPWYALIIGSDTRKGTAVYTGDPSEHGQTEQHADVVTLLRVDPQNYVVTLVTIPSATQIPDTSSVIGDALESDDPQDVVEAAEQITGVQIPYYLMVDFSGFEALVDDLGGVVVDVPVDMSLGSPISAANVEVSAGEGQLLGGEEALVCARDLSSYESQKAAQRQEMVRQLEQALIDDALGAQSELRIESVLQSVEDNIETNIDLAQAGAVLRDFAQHVDAVTVYACTGPYKTTRVRGMGTIVKDDPATWRALMYAVGAGEDPSGIVD